MINLYQKCKIIMTLDVGLKLKVFVILFFFLVKLTNIAFHRYPINFYATLRTERSDRICEKNKHENLASVIAASRPMPFTSINFLIIKASS